MVVFGILGVVVLCVGLMFVVVYLLIILFLNFIGGLFFLWIVISFLKGEDDGDIKVNLILVGVIKIIIIVDFVMSLDNVVVVVGVVNGSILFIIFGFVISILLIIWGS